VDDRKNRPELETLVSLYRHILKIEAGDIGTWLRLGVSLNLLGNDDEAGAAFTQARNYRKGEAWNAYALSVEYLFTGKTALAVDAQQKAHRLAAHSPIQNEWAGLNLEFCRLGEPESIASACRQFIALTPNHAEVWRQLGLALVKMSQHEEAAEAMNKCVAFAPDDPAGWRSLVDILWQPEKTEARLKAHRRYLELAPSDVDGWHHYANSLRTSGELKEEIAVCEKIVRLSPKDAGAWKRLSDVYGRAGLHHKKLRAYRHCQELQSAQLSPDVQMELF
jgi:tetratricopeptide (TPR) repeat protein